jgi:hypothetical protein
VTVEFETATMTEEPTCKCKNLNNSHLTHGRLICWWRKWDRWNYGFNEPIEALDRDVWVREAVDNLHFDLKEYELDSVVERRFRWWCVRNAKRESKRRDPTGCDPNEFWFGKVVFMAGQARREARLALDKRAQPVHKKIAQFSADLYAEECARLWMEGNASESVDLIKIPTGEVDDVA